MRHRFKEYCKDYKNIENYEIAAADNFKNWCIHHRLETNTSDGERRLVDISRKELIALSMYYDRPAEELIFIKESEHNTLHHKGKHLPKEAKKKMSEARKGENNAMYGKKHSDEAKKKMSEAKKGKKLSAEHRRKLSEACKNRPDELKRKFNKATKYTHWYNNGEINVRVKECPEGFVPGRLKHK